MIFQTLPPFNPVANGARAILQIPRLALTLGRVILSFPGTNSITKSSITEIVLKVGSRVVWGPVSGAELDAINKYRGIYDDTAHLTVDLFERDGMTLVAKEIGGIDLPNLGGQDVFLEVVNNAASGTPSLSAVGVFSALQNDPNPGKDPKTGKPKARTEQAIRKLLRYVIPSNGGTLQTWMPNFRGAIVQRVHFRYSGTDWTATADGNLKQVLAKKNGIALFDNVRCLDMRFIQQEQRKVPQSKMYTMDFVVDNVHSAALSTADARQLQFDLTLTANDTVVALVEVLDKPNNL